ncbi:hypothetical protein GN244_ATG02294 [Phytophthora infestans]|uniref:Uncharacterized protein n=1 Tax=Phytophthora infestans TaxID=4787 RepID=A0A833X1C4_PHYIN|nr:hypothetical protein GN244_ATG02294 [Phytophthora infestans]
MNRVRGRRDEYIGPAKPPRIDFLKVDLHLRKPWQAKETGWFKKKLRCDNASLLSIYSAARHDSLSTSSKQQASLH